MFTDAQYTKQIVYILIISPQQIGYATSGDRG